MRYPKPVALVFMTCLVCSSVLGFCPPVVFDVARFFSADMVRHPRYMSTRTTSFKHDHSGRNNRGRCLWSSEDNMGERMDGASGDGGDIQSGGSGAVEEGQGDPPSLAALVEKTFVMAASANSYVEGLDAFIRVVKEAYERGYTVPALMMEISFLPTKIREEHRASSELGHLNATLIERTAGRDLFPDEVELRSVWIALVYLTLEQAHWPQKVQRPHEISARFMDQFADFVSKVMTAAAKGHTLQTLKLEEVMRRSSEPRTPMEAAILSQSMRIVFATLDIMKEGWSG